jgi:hypothetical protein
VVVLAKLKHALVRFDDHSYRWIDIKRFPWDGLGEDRAILASLISSLYYRDTYISPDSHEYDSETVHGPYRVADISPGDFEGLTPEAAKAVVDEFSGLYQSPPGPEVLREIESLVLPLFRVAAWYRLRHLPHAEHEWASVLWEFRELVALSREDREIVLIVMAID